MMSIGTATIHLQILSISLPESIAQSYTKPVAPSRHHGLRVIGTNDQPTTPVGSLLRD